MAQPALVQANPEKPRVHSPLGHSDDLARHLILGVLTVPA